MTGRVLIAVIACLDLALAQSSQKPLKVVTDRQAVETEQPPTALAWAALNKGLQANDPEHRRQTVAALGTIRQSTEAIRLVEKALQDDKDTPVRQTAAATLGDMGARRAIPALRAALDDNPEVSFSAAKALWDLGDPSGRWIFHEVLEGERKERPGLVKGALRDARRKLNSPGQLALMGVKEATGQFLGPASMGITIAQEGLKDGGAPGRVAVAGFLAKDSDPEALTLLESALADKSWAVRAAVAKALGERGNRATIPKLAEALSDDRYLVRVMAAASIVKLSTRRTGSRQLN